MNIDLLKQTNKQINQCYASERPTWLQIQKQQHEHDLEWTGLIRLQRRSNGIGKSTQGQVSAQCAVLMALLGGAIYGEGNGKGDGDGDGDSLFLASRVMITICA